MIDGEDRIELVILIEYTQRNTINAEDTDTGAERDHTYPETTDQGEEEAAEPGNQDYTAAFGNVSPVYLEVWRSCPDSGCRAGNDRNVAQLLGRSTRSSTRTASPAPHMCQRFKIYPAATSSQKQVTFLLTDFVGSDVLEDAPGLLRWEVPISLFSNAVHLKRTIAEAHSGVPRKKKLRAGEILMEEQEIVKENVMGLARGGVLREVSAQETQQTQKRRRVA
ncbi:hypothetical protein EV426DRAFT_626597 [Tirmania nivea]|nr:hypothetical protein EV426DRAFT_626597 [Tirmania nivea]